MSRTQAVAVTLRQSVHDLRIYVMMLLVGFILALGWWLAQPPWITIEHVGARWYPQRLVIVVSRDYEKRVQCEQKLGWDIYVEQQGGLIRGPFRRVTPSIHPTGTRIEGVPLEVDWPFVQPPPRRVMVHVHCLAETKEGVAELDAVFPAQRAPLWADVIPSWRRNSELELP